MASSFLRRVIRFLPAGALCLSPAFGVPVPVASSAFEAVCEDLRAGGQVQADFVEEKKLRILEQPLHSKGTLLFDPQRGVYRITEKPTHQELLITRSHLVQKDAQGAVQRMAVRGQPAAQAFVDVFLSFFSGDRRQWDKAFEATFSGVESDWTILLVPRRKSPAAKALREIRLKGRQGLLDAMTLTEANGDTTHTVYSRHQLFPADSPEAAARFPSDLTTR